MKLRRTIKPLGGPVDVTPLIDVVLLLIIFFMLSSTFVLQPGIKVTPPRGLNNSGVSDSRYVINVTAQDPPMIFINDQITTLEQIGSDLRSIARESSEPLVVLRADRDVKHGVVAEIMNKALEAGVTVLIATQPVSDGEL